MGTGLEADQAKGNRFDSQPIPHHIKAHRYNSSKPKQIWTKMENMSKRPRWNMTQKFGGK